MARRSNRGIFVVAVLCALVAHGIDWDSLEYVTQTASDGGYGESSFLLGAHWSDGRIPHGDAHYMVPYGNNIYGIASVNQTAWQSAPTNKTFQGGSISIGGDFYINFIDMTIPNLRLLDGGVYINNSYGGLYGTATVSSVTSPFDFRLVRSSSGDPKFPVVAMTFLGAADAKVHFSRYNNNLQAGFRLQNSDFSKYFGTIINGTGIDGKGGGTNTYGNAIIPGTCIVSTNSSIKLENSSRTALMGTLCMETNSVLYLPASATGNASITVTNRFEVSAGTKFVIEGAENAVIGGNSRMALIKLTGNAALNANLPDVSTLVLGYQKGASGLPEAGQLSLEDDETTGGKAIYATFTAINNLATSTTSSKSAFSMDAADAPNYWSLGHVPQAGEDVRISNLAATLSSDGDFVFPGSSLTIASGGDLYLQSSGFSGGKVYAMEGGTIESVSGSQSVSSKTIGGFSNAQGFDGDELWICGPGSGSVIFAVAQARTLVVTAPLCGTGTAMAATRWSTSYPYGAIAFLADNSAFAGRFIAKTRNQHGYQNSSTGWCLRFYMDNANNVGGAMASFAYNGFTVSEDAIVIGRQALTFSEQTRGVFVENRARFVMQNENRLTFNVPVTWRGEMVFGNDYPNADKAKTGPGTGDLVLGSRAQFLTDGGTVSADPDAGSTSNRLLMVVGRVKPMTTNALDGVAVTFGANAGGILLDIDPAGDGMAEYGLHDVKWDVPFTSHRADGKIPVAFEGMVGTEYKGPPFMRGICTVSATAAQSLADGDFAVAKPYSNVAVRVTHVTNANGTVTFKASFWVRGMVFSVR